MMKNILGVGLLSILSMTACNLGSTSSSSSGSSGGSGQFTVSNLESTVVLGSGCSQTGTALSFVCSAASSSMAVNNIAYTSNPASYLFIPMVPKGVTITSSGNCATEPVTSFGSCSLAFTAESVPSNSTVYIPLTNSPLTPAVYQIFISVNFQ